MINRVACVGREDARRREFAAKPCQHVVQVVRRLLLDNHAELLEDVARCELKLRLVGLNLTLHRISGMRQVAAAE